MIAYITRHVLFVLGILLHPSSFYGVSDPVSHSRSRLLEMVADSRFDLCC